MEISRIIELTLRIKGDERLLFNWSTDFYAAEQAIKRIHLARAELATLDKLVGTVGTCKHCFKFGKHARSCIFWVDINDN